MRKIILLPIVLVMFLTAFSSPSKVSISDVETTIIKAERTLRYDLIIKNEGTSQIGDKFDYPGHNHYGLELVIKPNKELAALMEKELNTKYSKMLYRGGGGRGSIKPGEEANFHVEYQIKRDADIDQVKKNALKGTLLLLDGTKIIAEIPLKE